MPLRDEPAKLAFAWLWVPSGCRWSTLIFRENACVAIVGCIAGLLPPILASRVLASFLYEISPHDPWVLLASIAVLLMIASCASLLPAIQAARIDPILAIRCE